MSCSANEISLLIWKISKFWLRGKQRMMDEFDLTGPQLEILGALHHLSKERECITQNALSLETGIDRMTTSTIVRNLQKKGLLERSDSKTDTRARNIELTESGANLFLEAHEKANHMLNSLFSNIDQKALKEQLQILLSELNKHDEFLINK